MENIIIVVWKGKQYWYYDNDIFAWWDGELEGTWDRPMYASAISDDGYYTIEWDEDGNIADITNDFR